MAVTRAFTTSQLDVDGNELILDSDGDTSITADTDDQIDIKVGGSDKVVIDSSGNVGIGTTSPSQKLDVNGTINTTGNLTINGTSLKDVSETLTNKTINSASNTITITESNISDLGSYLENVVEDTTPQLGGNLDTNGNDISFGDNDKAIFGAGSDLQIYHNGTSSFIEDTGSGDLFIRGAANVQIEGSTAGENMIYATENGAVRLYYDANQKLATTNTGIDVTGTVVSDGLTVDTNTLYVDATNNRVGIGTSSPTAELDVTGTVIADGLILSNSGNIEGSTVMRISSSDGARGSIQISAPHETTRAVTYGNNFYVTGASTYAQDSTVIGGMLLEMTASNSDYGAAVFKAKQDPDVGGAIADRLKIDTNGDISFYEDTGTTPKLFWDASAERLGIGTSSPSNLLHITGSSSQFKGQNGAEYFELLNDSVNSIFRSTGAIFIRTINADPIIFQYNTSSESMRIDPNGNLYVGESSGGAAASKTIRTRGFNTRTGTTGSLQNNTFNINWSNPNASLWIDTTNIGTFISASDYRIKRNVETQTESALNRIAQLRPVTYQPADYGAIFTASDEIKEGFIAHELAEIIPSAVEGEKDAEDQVQSLKLDALCSVMVKAIQEQQTIIEDLQTRITALENN